MATQEECEAALRRVAASLAGNDEKKPQMANRSVSATVPDLNLTFTGRLRDGALTEMTSGPAGTGAPAQLRLTVSSDDLVALTDGRLGFATAWAQGRLKVQANPLDLLRLRRLL